MNYFCSGAATIPKHITKHSRHSVMSHMDNQCRPHLAANCERLSAVCKVEVLVSKGVSLQMVVHSINGSAVGAGQLEHVSRIRAPWKYRQYQYLGCGALLMQVVNHLCDPANMGMSRCPHSRHALSVTLGALQLMTCSVSPTCLTNNSMHRRHSFTDYFGYGLLLNDDSTYNVRQLHKG